MDQQNIGKFIAQKRKEQNLTQEQLAQCLGVSNKTVSKWETGKCMPDYSVVKGLCAQLHITVAELLDGAPAGKNAAQASDEQVMELLRRTQALEKEKVTLYGILLIVMGIALLAVSHSVGGSDLQDFLSGVLLGISVGAILTGMCVSIKSLAKPK